VKTTLNQIERHAGARLFDLILANNRFDEKVPLEIEWVKTEKKDGQYQIYETDLVDKENPWRHNSTKVAKTIIDLYMERTGPLGSKETNSTI